MFFLGITGLTFGKEYYRYDDSPTIKSQVPIKVGYIHYSLNQYPKSVL